jgi:serine/threonine protein kinase
MDHLSENSIVLKTYRLERIIGQGAFGRVFKATHINLKGDRAIKVLLRHDVGVGSSDYEEYRNRFRQESQLMERLKHPNIIQIFDFQEEDDTLFLVMEYAAGGSLKEKLDQYRAEGKTFSLEEIEKTGREIASGLSSLHALDVVHRDLKPSNILFDGQANVRVADLGLAQIPGGASMRSMLSVAKSHPGTPAYMSPEQETTGHYLGPSSDVYSLGLILFEMATGRLYKNIKPGSRISDFRPDFPPWLDELTGSMLLDDARKRPWDGNEVAARFSAGPSAGQKPETVIVDTRRLQSVQPVAQNTSDVSRDATESPAAEDKTRPGKHQTTTRPESDGITRTIDVLSPDSQSRPATPASGGSPLKKYGWIGAVILLAIGFLAFIKPSSNGAAFQSPPATSTPLPVPTSTQVIFPTRTPEPVQEIVVIPTATIKRPDLSQPDEFVRRYWENISADNCQAARDMQSAAFQNAVDWNGFQEWCSKWDSVEVLSTEILSSSASKAKVRVKVNFLGSAPVMNYEVVLYLISDGNGGWKINDSLKH